MNIALLGLAIPICIADLNAFVIPNIYNKMLFYVALTHMAYFGFSQFTQYGISLIILVALFLLRTGMGDLKLLGLILVTHSFSAVEYMGYVLVFALVHFMVITAVHRTIPSKIALAPSIFTALGTYLATGW